MAFSEEFWHYYCRDCWPPVSLSRDLVTVPGVGVSRVRSCPVHGPVSVDAVVTFTRSREEQQPCPQSPTPDPMPRSSAGGGAAPELTEDEARLQDLLALYGATRELIREQRDLLGYYDSEADLFGDEPPFG